MESRKINTHLFLYFIVFSIFSMNFTSCHITTKDKNFKKIYHPTYIKEGDGKTYPKDGEFAVVHISIYNAQTNEFYHSTEDNKKPYLHLMGHNYPTAKCFGEVIERMSLGEKTYFICPPEAMFGDDWGLGGRIPGGIDLGVLVDLMDIKEFDEVIGKEEQDQGQIMNNTSQNNSTTDSNKEKSEM